MKYYTAKTLRMMINRYKRTIEELEKTEFDGFSPGLRKSAIEQREKSIADLQELIDDLELTIASRTKGNDPP